MSILVACSNCQKKYKVDDKFAGKKAKCKACGAAFSVPALPKAAEPEDDLLAGLHEASASEHRATGAPATNFSTRPEAQSAARPAPKSAPRPTAKPASRPAAQPAARPADRPASNEIGFAGESDPVAPVEGACPGCGKPLAPSAALCVSCGYSRATGRVLTTQLSRDTIPGTRTSGGLAPAATGEERDYAGVRTNVPYTNAFLSIVDWLVPKIAFFLFLGIIGFSLVAPIYVMVRFPPSSGIPVGKLVTGTFVEIVAFGLTWGIIFPVTLYGIKLAGRIMKFELPENTFSRLLAVHLSSAFPGFVLSFLVVGVASASASAQGGPNPNTLAALGLGLIIGVIFLYLALCFPAFLFFYRLKILEALVAFPLMIAFFVLGLFSSGAIILLLGFVIGLLFGHPPP